jgi:hypothetical protein
MADDDATIDENLSVQRVTAATPEAKFNADCETVFRAGVRSQIGFEESVERLRGAEVTTPDFLQQVLELDAPEKVLHQLGQEENLDTAKKLAKLSPVKRAAALATLERGEAFVEKTGTPMWKRSRSDLSNESLSDKAWSALYDKRHGRGGLPRR